MESKIIVLDYILKTLRPHFFDELHRSGGIFILRRTERTSTIFSVSANFQSVFQNEHTTNNAEQERTENAACKVPLNEIVRRTAAEKRTDNEQRK